jgi:uncharacterized protein YndB with AHSA1/START domain/HEAT repeat protein
MNGVVILEVTYPYPVERVWRALTDSRALAKWLMPNDFEPRLGHKFCFVGEPQGVGREVIECEVIELERPCRLGYTWRDQSGRSPSIVTWTLMPVAEGTCLRLEHRESDTAVAGDWEGPLVELETLLGDIQRAVASGSSEDATLEVGREQLQYAVELLGLGWKARRVRAAASHILVSAGQAGMDAVIEGLSHPNPTVRRGCAEFLDDHGTEAHVATLLHVVQNDPDAGVRYAAAHSLGCQECKVSPVQVDLVPPLIEIALSDKSARVRREAVIRLCGLPPDPRAVAALQTILSGETGRRLWMWAHRALMRHDKVSPVPVDLISPMIQRVLSGEHLQVRRDATRWLGVQPPDPRIAVVLRTVLSRETNRESLEVVHRALMRHDQAYRQAHIEKCKARCRASSLSAMSTPSAE